MSFLSPDDYRKSNEVGYVYAVTDDGLRHKIGMAADIKHRISSLQTSHSQQLYLTDVLVVEKPRVRLVERFLHKDLGYRRLRGEWFGIDRASINDLFSFARIRWLDDDSLDLNL